MVEEINEVIKKHTTPVLRWFALYTEEWGIEMSKWKRCGAKAFIILFPLLVLGVSWWTFDPKDTALWFRWRCEKWNTTAAEGRQRRRVYFLSCTRNRRRCAAWKYACVYWRTALSKGICLMMWIFQCEWKISIKWGQIHVFPKIIIQNQLLQLI